MVEVGPDLVESTGFRGGLHEGDFPMFGVVAGAEGIEFSRGGIGAWHHGLADIDPAGLMFAEPVERLVDDPRCGGSAMDDGEVAFVNFPALLHFA